MRQCGCRDLGEQTLRAPPGGDVQWTEEARASLEGNRVSLRHICLQCEAGHCDLTPWNGDRVTRTKSEQGERDWMSFTQCLSFP